MGVPGHPPVPAPRNCHRALAAKKVRHKTRPRPGRAAPAPQIPQTPADPADPADPRGLHRPPQTPADPADPRGPRRPPRIPADPADPCRPRRPPRTPADPRPRQRHPELQHSHGPRSRSHPRSAAAAAAGGCGERAAPGPDPGGPRGRAPPEAVHGLAAAGWAARLRGLPHRRAVGAERRALRRGDGRRSLPGPPGRPLADRAGAPQTPVPGARPDPPPRQQHPQQQGRPPPPPAGGESGAERGRAGAAVPAGGQGRGGRHGVRGGGLGHRQPQRPPAGQALRGGAAGDQPRRLQPPHPPRPHHHREDDVHRLPQEGHLQGRLRRPPGLRWGGRGGGHGRLPRLRQLQEARHLHPHRPVRGLDRRCHGLGGWGGGRSLSPPRGPSSTPRHPRCCRHGHGTHAAARGRAAPGASPHAGTGAAGPARDRGEGVPSHSPLLTKHRAWLGKGGGPQPPTLVQATGFAERARNADCDPLQIKP